MNEPILLEDYIVPSGRFRSWQSESGTVSVEYQVHLSETEGLTLSVSLNLKATDVALTRPRETYLFLFRSKHVVPSLNMSHIDYFKLRKVSSEVQYAKLLKGEVWASNWADGAVDVANPLPEHLWGKLNRYDNQVMTQKSALSDAISWADVEAGIRHCQTIQPLLSVDGVLSLSRLETLWKQNHNVHFIYRKISENTLRIGDILLSGLEAHVVERLLEGQPFRLLFELFQDIEVNLSRFERH